MIKSLIIFFLLMFTGCGISKKTLIKTVEAYSLKGQSEDSIFRSLQERNKIIIGYFTHNPAWNTGTFFQLFALNGKHWTAYKYSIKSVYMVGEKPYDLDSFPVPKKYGDSVLKIFKKNKSWELRINKRDDGNECPHIDLKKGSWCSISDASDEWLTINTKTHSNGVKFYAPEYYEYECCPGWTDRQRYLATIAPIKAFFKKFFK